MPRSETIDRTKVVVRKLPPYLKEEDFKTELDKHVEGTYKWFLFAPGKASSKKVTYARAYVAFNDIREVLDFKTKFDGFVFVGARGTQYKCTVEYAPYQRIPKPTSKKDPREGTIEKDPDFKAFVESLEKGPVMLPSAQKQFEEELSQRLASGEGEDGIRTTPLMEFIINKHLIKAANAREKREAKQRDSRNSRKAKAKSLPPSVKIKTRPSPKPETLQRSDSKRNSGGRNRRNPRIREGHEAWVPHVMRKKTSLSEEKSSEKDDHSDSTATTVSTTAENSKPPPKANKDSEYRGRGRSGAHGYSRRGGRSEGRGNTGRPNVKVVWIPKTDRTKSE